MKPFCELAIFAPMWIGLMASGLSSCNNRSQQSQAAQTQEEAQPPTARRTRANRIDGPLNQVGTRIGFRSRNQLDEHFAKHGTEFGNISEQEYLRAAQELRDRTIGGEVLEIVRDDGTVSRFDRSSGAFLAFDRDGTIRTFFKPNDGERYFRRQAQRSY